MRLIGVRKVFDNGLHNAFTSVAWFQGVPYLAFRSGASHVSADGRVLVLRGDRLGQNWLPVAVIWAGIDTRGPKLMVTPEGLFVYCFERHTGPDRVVSGYAFSADGDSWEPWRPLEPDLVYWRPEWLAGGAYVGAYGREPGGDEGPVWLKRSGDGRTWRDVCRLVGNEDASSPNEAALTMTPDERMWALVRRESGSKQPLLGWAAPPYDHWNWQELPIKLQGPYLWLAGEHLYLSGRWYQPSGLVNTTVFRMEGGQPVPQVILPSAGDTSYMGAIPAAPDNGLDRHWWLSYYSSHEHLGTDGGPDLGAIYLAELELD